MSFWSAIGLADRKNLENLALQIQELRDENRELRSENQKLLLENRMMLSQQMQSFEVQVMQGQAAGISDILQDMNEKHSQDREKFQLFEAEFKKLKAGQDTFQSVLGAQGDSIQDAVARAEGSAGNRYDGLAAGIELLQRGQEKIASRVDEQGSSVREAVRGATERQESAVQKAFGDTVEKQRSAIQDSNKDLSKRLEEAGKKAEDIVSSSSRMISSYLGKMEKDQEEDLREMSGQLENAIREFKDTRKHYDSVIRSEDQWLGRLEKLSNDLVSLHESQLKAMEYLSQVCQDSDQFMEIQKSINGMWEIMKVIWVDSLLDGLEK